MLNIQGGYMNKKDGSRYKCGLFPYERQDCLSLQEAKQNAGWNITAFNLPKAWEYSQGEGVVIAVLDTGCDLNHPDLIDNLLPGYNFVTPGKDPVDGNGHGCISPETLVHTSSGIESIETLYNKLDCPEVEVNHTTDGCYSVKNVSDLKIKTYSLDPKNIKTVVSDVESIQKLRVKEEIVRIELEGNIEFNLTPWHPVYLLRNKRHDVYEVIRKRADEVCLNDRFMFPEQSIDMGETQYTPICEIFTCTNCGHEPKYWIGDVPTKCKKCRKSEWHFSIKEVEITPDLGWLCGIVITDGYVHKGANRFEVSSNTYEILEKVQKISEKLGFTSAVEENRVLVYGKKAVDLLLGMGVLSKNKSLTQDLPLWVGKANNEVKAAFVAGVVDGDGCISKTNTKNRITTGSFQFAQQMCALLNSMSISCGVSKPEFDKRQRIISSSSPVFKITHSALSHEIVNHLIHPNKIKRSMICLNHKRKARKVRSVTKQFYDGFFYDFTIKDYHNYIANGHFVSNTHVIGTLVAMNNDIGVVGVCPKAKVRPVKVLADDGNGNLINVAKGIRWAIEQKVDLISMSLGAPFPVQEVRKAIQAAQDAGIVCFVAAGNAGNTKDVFYPSRYPETIAVGAVDINMRRASFSNTGLNLDFMAPGVDIFSTVPDSWYATLSGTSMAQPFVCGVGALLLSYARAKRPDIKLRTAQDYIEFLKKYTIPVQGDVYEQDHFYQGFGIIDPQKFIESM